MVYATVEEIVERVKARRETAAAGGPDGLEPVHTAGD
jgi:hypothetical protein